MYTDNKPVAFHNGGTVTNRVEFYAQLPFRIQKREKWYLASCLILDIHSQGSTPKKAEKNLVEALSLFLVSCFERGVLDQVLKECGFKSALHKKLPGYRKTVHVPIPLAVDTHEAVKCPA